MKVLVTGATGFVGSNLTEHLLECGYQVRVIVRKPEAINNQKLEVIPGDIRDKQVITEAVNGCQQIYHIAGKTSRTNLSKQEFWEINVEATRNLAEAAIKANVEKFVYASTVGVYGILSDFAVDEQTPTSPNTIYRRTKLAGEKILLSYYENQGLPVVIARLPSMVGKNGTNWLGLTKAIAAQNYKLIGTGNNQYNLIHIDDAVRGLRLCGESPQSVGNIYLIGFPESITFRKFITMIADELGVDFPEENKFTLPFEVFFAIAKVLHQNFHIEIPLAHRYEIFLTSRILDTTKATQELGFVPKLSLEQGVTEMIQSLKENGYL